MTEGFSLVLPTTRCTAELDLAAIVEDFSVLLFRVAHAVLRNPAEAEDVVQDVFVRVLQHERSLPAVRDLRVWLVRIAWNLAIDRRRRIRPEQMDNGAAAALATPMQPQDDAVDEGHRLAVVFRAIDSLPKAERQALLLTTLDELTAVEVGVIMGKSESAVRALVFRARMHLRQRLDGRGHR